MPCKLPDDWERSQYEPEHRAKICDGTGRARAHSDGAHKRSSRRMAESKMGAFCTRSCPFSSPSSSFTSKSLQNWTRSVSRNASESGWKRSNRHSKKPPVRPREPRVAAVSDFPDTAGRVPTGSSKPDVAPPCGSVAGTPKHRRRTSAGNFGQRAKPQAAKQEKAKVSCAHLGEHICPQCGQFGAFTQGLLRGQK